MPAPPGRYNGPHDDEVLESECCPTLQRQLLQAFGAGAGEAAHLSGYSRISSASGDRPLVGLAVTGRVCCVPHCGRLTVTGLGRAGGVSTSDPANCHDCGGLLSNNVLAKQLTGPARL